MSQGNFLLKIMGRISVVTATLDEQQTIEQYRGRTESLGIC